MRPAKLVQGLIDLVEYISNKKSKDLVMVEVGSYAGQSMEIFANTHKIKTIICIDPWLPGYDSKDKSSSTDFNEVEKLFDEKCKKIKDVNIIKHKGTLDTFIKSLEFEKLKTLIDFVYVDGCHTYEAVKHDLTICKKVIKPNIAYAGHDYGDYCKDVKNVVNEEFGKPDKVFSDYSWVKSI